MPESPQLPLAGFSVIFTHTLCALTMDVASCEVDVAEVSPWPPPTKKNMDFSPVTSIVGKV